MGRTVDFAKRRIAGYIVFWLVVFFFLYVMYQGQQLSPSLGLGILLVAFIVSVWYTRRMKRKQRQAREARGR